MPITTITEARNCIAQHLLDHWSNVLQFPPEILWDDKEREPPANDDWVRVSIVHNVGEHVTIGGRLSGGQRFRRRGLVTVQIFAISGDGLETADGLVEAALDAFEGKSTSDGTVEFTDAI